MRWQLLPKSFYYQREAEAIRGMIEEEVDKRTLVVVSDLQDFGEVILAVGHFHQEYRIIPLNKGFVYRIVTDSDVLCSAKSRSEIILSRIPGGIVLGLIFSRSARTEF